MSHPGEASSVARRAPSAAPSRAAVHVTVFGCGPEEAALFRRLAPRFGVVPAIIEAPASEANSRLARAGRYVSVGHKTRITDATLRALRRAGVMYVSTRSVGYDHIDITYAERIGICVENVAYSPDSVADYTVMLMLMLIRHAKVVLRRADMHDYRLLDMPGREMRDLTVGVIATGRIGAAVVNRLAGFGCRVLAHDDRRNAQADYVSLRELLERSDVVTLHTPLTTETHHLLDARRIALMKRGALIVNTGRGGLVDSEALLRALESGRLGGAALDVLEDEAGIFYADCRDVCIDDHAVARLQRLPNVIVSPHTAYYTDHALEDLVEGTLRNIVRFERRHTHA